MSDDTMVTEREAVLRERAAFKGGARALYYDEKVPSSDDLVAALHRVEDAAPTRYPLPRVARLRVVRDPLGTNYGPASGHSGPLHWAVRDGRIIPVTEDGTFIRAWEDNQRRDSYPTPNRVRVWADLLDRPTEEVEADA